MIEVEHKNVYNFVKYVYILSLFLQESYEAGIIIYIVREGNQDLRGTGKCPSFQLALEPR